MFRIKICGITNPDDARMVAQAGADAVGLNFYAGSSRHVAADAAEQIVAVLPRGVIKVGVFVDTPVAEICQLVDHLHLDLIQLHGDQTPAFVAQLAPHATIRAFRLGDAGDAGVLCYVEECRQRGCPLRMVLLDAFVAGSFGGTGEAADWAAVQSLRQETALPPLVLAGGLKPENVAAAIRATGAAAVDTASGVESSAGHKDPRAVAAFVAAARAAFAEPSPSPSPSSSSAPSFSASPRLRVPPFSAP